MQSMPDLVSRKSLLTFAFILAVSFALDAEIAEGVLPHYSCISNTAYKCPLASEEKTHAKACADIAAARDQFCNVPDMAGTTSCKELHKEHHKRCLSPQTNWKHVSVSADIAPEPAATDLDLSIADGAQENAKADIALGENAKTGATLGENANRRRRSYAASSNGGCPTGDNYGDNWIKWVEVTSVTRDRVNTKYTGRNAASTSQLVKIYQLAVNTVPDTNAKGTDYGDEYSKGEYPGTAAVMGLHNDVVKKYNEGFFAHDKDKDINNDLKFGQPSLTRDAWWKLGANCFAMASYSEVKQDSEDEFKPKGTFAKAINLRIAKLTVCKLFECQEKKIVMDCWIKGTGSNWEQCDHFQDESFVASIAARG